MRKSLEELIARSSFRFAFLPKPGGDDKNDKHCVATAIVAIAPIEREKKKKRKKVKRQGYQDWENRRMWCVITTYRILQILFRLDENNSLRVGGEGEGGSKYNLYCRWIVIPG